MATWTTPTTNRGASYVPTATDWNQTADNLRFLQYQGAMIRHSTMTTNASGHSLASGAWTDVMGAVSTVEWATHPDMIVDEGGGVHSFEVPTGMGGWWHFDVWGAVSSWTYSAVDQYSGIGIRHYPSGGGSTDYVQRFEGPHVLFTSGRIHSAGWSLYLAAGDQVAVILAQDSGSTRKCSAWMHAQWISGGSGTRPTWAELATPTIGSTVTNTIWNNVQGNLKWLHERPYCWIKRTSTWTSPNNTAFVIDFNATDVYDASGMHDPAGAAAWAVDAPYDGIYLVEAVVETPSAVTAGRRELRVYKVTLRSGSTWTSTGSTTDFPGTMGGICQVNTNFNSFLWGSAYVPLRAGDRIGIAHFQDSGGDITMQSAQAQVTYLGKARNSPWGDHLELAPGPQRPI